MKKIYSLLSVGAFCLSFLVGCVNTSSSSSSTNSSSVSSSKSTSTSVSSSSTVESLNNLKGTFNRPYAPYYKEGEALLDDPYVLYINFDGFARYYLDAYLANEEYAKESTIKKLMSEGVFFNDFNNALPSITNPCQNQILSGATTAVTENVYRYYSKTLNEVIQQERENSSKILPQVTVENGISTASVCHYLAEPYLSGSDISKLYVTSDPTDKAVAGTPLEGSYLDRFNQLIKLVKGEPLKTYGKSITVSELPRFMILYVDDLDAIGHNEKAYYEFERATTEVQRMKNVISRLKNIDDKIGEFIEACKTKGIYDKLTVFLTTDHGMASFGIQSENDTENYGKSKFGELCSAIKTFNNTYNVKMLSAGQSADSGTSVVAVGMNLNVQLTWRDGITEAQMQQLKTYLMTKKYVGNVLTKAELEEQGYWTNAADMIVTPAEHYCFSNQLLATYSCRGQHDSTLPQAKQIVGLAWGKGIKKGYVYEETAYNYDFGVTMAACLGVTLPNANGIVLDIFEKE